MEVGNLMRCLNSFEIKCLLGKSDECDSSFCEQVSSYCETCNSQDLFKRIVEKIVQQDYESILNIKLDEFGFVLKVFFKRGRLETTDSGVQDKNPNELSTYVNNLIVLFVGISALQEFLKVNFTGPISKIKFFQIVNDVIHDQNIVKTEIESFLSRDGEFIYSNVNNPELLYLSQVLLDSLDHDICVSSKWWLMRCWFAHQLILPERNVFLHTKLKELLEIIPSSIWINCEENVSTKLIFIMEGAQIHLYYHEIVLAKKYVDEAMEICGLEVSLSGAKGKRTQHQQKPVAQLFVKINRKISKLNGKDEFVDTNTDYPCDLLLQDDTLLNAVKFLDNDENAVNDLSAYEQVLLLNYCCLVKRSSSYDELLQEEVLSYISCLLSQPKIWCIYLKALILRCKAEKSSSRRLERAIMQMEAIVNALKSNKPTFTVRQNFIFCAAFPTYWAVEKELADLLLSIGATKSALEIYERLHLWEDVIFCYQQLGRTHCAKKLILEQIEKKETPMLWCLLGDVTDNPDHYLKAWECSDHKSARALRSLGYYYFKRKDFKESISYFEKALDLNHLQPTVWFSLGYASTQVENFELAAKAYRQVVTLDQDNFEAWNNLSNAYIKTKQKLRAWRSLQEALKCNYEEWRVWENFLLVSIDVGAFEDVIRSFHRLLDIKGKHKDSEVLGILVKAILKDLPDINNFPASRLKTRTLELFGRLTSIITSDAKTWELYSSLYNSNDNSGNDKDSLEKAVLFQQKAVRYYSMKDQWEKSFASSKEVLENTLKLANLSLSYIKLLENDIKTQHRSSAKLTIQSVVARSKKFIEYFTECERTEISTLLTSLEEEVNEIIMQ